MECLITSLGWLDGLKSCLDLLIRGTKRILTLLSDESSTWTKSPLYLPDLIRAYGWVTNVWLILRVSGISGMGTTRNLKPILRDERVSWRSDFLKDSR